MVHMFVLADFSVIKPEPGLIFWTTLSFALFWFLMSRFAFKPISNALKVRENDIQSAMDEAKKVREEMENLKAENEQIIKQAREDRAQIIKAANDTANKMVNEAKDTAKVEANRILHQAKEEITAEKMAAMDEVRKSVGQLAINIAEEVVKKQLGSDPAQAQLVDELIKNAKFN